MRGPFVLVGWPTAPVAGFGATAIRVGRGGIRSARRMPLRRSLRPRSGP